MARRIDLARLLDGHQVRFVRIHRAVCRGQFLLDVFNHRLGSLSQFATDGNGRGGHKCQPAKTVGGSRHVARADTDVDAEERGDAPCRWADVFTQEFSRSI